MAKNTKAAPMPATTLGRKKLTPAEREARNESGYYEPDVRFKRVAGIRMAKVLKLMKGLRACANPAVYSYTDKQVSDMLKALTSATERVVKAFNEPSTNGRKTYTNKVTSFFGD